MLRSQSVYQFYENCYCSARRHHKKSEYVIKKIKTIIPFLNRKHFILYGMKTFGGEGIEDLDSNGLFGLFGSNDVMCFERA
ncbi:MAG: hypothetical protein DRJ37_06805 [Thermoprotei archaeon]|nr:MAG: hypothetical protein DRJ37_06805 [Thermoprotei archaeon]